MTRDDSTRCLRRTSTWNRNKDRLPKNSSLPELHLVVKERPLCRQCALTNSLITPTCLWCTWACKEAKHEFESSMPRARRASAPPRVFIRIALSPSSGKFTLLTDDHENIDSDRSAASSKQTGTNAKPSVIDPPPVIPSILSHMVVHHTLVDAVNSHRDHIYDTDTSMVNDLTRQHPVPATLEGFGDVATAACSFLASPSLAQTRTVTVERVAYNPEENNNAKTETESLTPTVDSSWISPLISEKISSATLRLESVDRPRFDPITATGPGIALKVSRGAFDIGCADKMPTFHLDDTHDHAKNVSLGHDETTPSPTKSAHSPKHQHFRPLRRKNHLHIMPSNPDLDASEPIAISLTLHSPTPTSSHLSKKSSQVLTDYVHTRAYSHPQSTASTDTPDPVTPPMTPAHQRSLPSSAPPKIKSAGTAGSSNFELSPVRLGHPSRPYYNAIRKNGISTPLLRTRPQSQPTPPPSSFHLGTSALVSTMSTTVDSPSRHLSMSAMLASPTPFSALSLVDDGGDDGGDDNGDFEVHSGPTNSARLSLSSSLHRLSYNSHTQSQAHNTQSLSRAKGILSSKSSGIGFSMSGETELRMALATSSPSGVATTLGRTTKDGFRFRETVIPSGNISNVDGTNARMDHIDTRCVGPRDSFMGRVKKLRKGLKEMLMNKGTTTATTATT